MQIRKSALWWIIGVIVVVLVIFGYSRSRQAPSPTPTAPTLSSTSAPSIIPVTPQAVVEEYFDAWGRRDWPAMYAVISDGFKRIDPNARDLDSFVQFAEAQDIMGVVTKEIREVANDGTTATIRYAVEFFLNNGSTRPFSDSFTLKFRKNDRTPGWKFIHPFGPNVDTSEDVAVAPAPEPEAVSPSPLPPTPTFTPSPTPSVTPALTTSPTSPSPSPTPTIRELTVAGDEFLFDPKNVTLKVGERVRLTFRNEGRVIHNWIIEGQGIGTQTIPGGGATTTIEFTAPKRGQYTVFCSVPGHRERGMVGTLVVE